MIPGACDRVLLVGFMGSGKSTVGRLIAKRLGWRFMDFDAAIARSAGAAIPEIFRQHGEAYFRELEGRIADGLLRERHAVLSSGGGWAATPGRLQGVPDGTVSFWLRVTPETAVSRAESRPGLRPLLVGSDPLVEASRLLAERTPYYGAADWAVDTEHATVEDVAARIMEILNREYPEISSR